MNSDCSARYRAKARQAGRHRLQVWIPADRAEELRVAAAKLRAGEPIELATNVAPVTIEKIVEVEKIIEVPVEIEKIVEVERIVERPIETVIEKFSTSLDDISPELSVGKIVYSYITSLDHGSSQYIAICKLLYRNSSMLTVREASLINTHLMVGRDALGGAER